MRKTCQAIYSQFEFPALFQISGRTSTRANNGNQYCHYSAHGRIMTVLISIFGPPRSYYQPCRAIFRENCSAWLIRLLAGQIIEIIQPWLIKRNLPSHVRMDICPKFVQSLSGHPLYKSTEKARHSNFTQLKLNRLRSH